MCCAELTFGAFHFVGKRLNALLTFVDKNKLSFRDKCNFVHVIIMFIMSKQQFYKLPYNCCKVFLVKSLMAVTAKGDGANSYKDVARLHGNATFT